MSYPILFAYYGVNNMFADPLQYLVIGLIIYFILRDTHIPVCLLFIFGILIRETTIAVLIFYFLFNFLKYEKVQKKVKNFLNVQIPIFRNNRIKFLFPIILSICIFFWVFFRFFFFNLARYPFELFYNLGFEETARGGYESRAGIEYLLRYTFVSFGGFWLFAIIGIWAILRMREKRYRNNNLFLFYMLHSFYIYNNVTFWAF